MEVEDKKDPAMEKQYLIKLYNTINKTIDDFEEFHEFGKRVAAPSRGLFFMSAPVFLPRI